MRRMVTYKIDLILLLAAAASLISSCVIVSPKKPFWNDELIAWTVIHDPSLSHMLSALRNNVDFAPPLFHLSARMWALVFGGEEMGLRLFASAGFCVALVLLWRTLRRYYGTIATGFGLLTIWCTSDLFLYQNSEARNYGLFCGAAALTVAAFCALAESGEKITLPVAGVTIASQVLLVMSHLYGIVYGAVTLLALAVWDLLNRRFRPAVYAIFAAGWLVLVPWLPTILRESQTSKPYGWIPVPTLADLARVSSFYISSHELFIFLALMMAGVLLASSAVLSVEKPAQSQPLRGGGPLIAVAIAYAAVPLVAYVGSHVVNPFFLDRYMLPSFIGAAILLATMAEALVEKANFLPAVPQDWRALASFFVFLVFAAFFAGLIANPIFRALGPPPLPDVRANLGPANAVEALLPRNLPVVTEQVYDFMTLTHYSPRPDRPYYFVVDLQAATDPRVPRWELFMQRERQNWKENGYMADRTLTTSEFLCSFDTFLVLHYPGLVWSEIRVQADPAFETQFLGMIGDRSLLWVNRRPGLLPTACR